MNGTQPASQAAIDAVAEVLRSGRLNRYDDRPYDETASGQLELALARLIGTRHCLALSSGTDALAVGLMALDLKPGSRVVIPAFGFPATATAVLQAGHVPVVSSVDEGLLLDPVHLDAHWDDRIAAIVPVHMRGMPANMVAIMELAGRRGVPVLEDAVPALGARLHGRSVGTFGIVGAFSTQSDKTLKSGEGGFAVTTDSDIHARMVRLSGAFEGRASRHPGVAPDAQLDMRTPLHNMRMDEVRATLLLEQVFGIQAYLDQITGLHDYASGLIGKIPGVSLRPITEGAEPLCDSILVKTPDGGAVARELQLRGYPVRNFATGDQVNIRDYRAWRFGCEMLSGSDFPRVDELLESYIDIPISVGVTREAIDAFALDLSDVVAHYLDGGLDE